MNRQPYGSQRVSDILSKKRARYYRGALLAVLQIFGAIGDDIAPLIATIVMLRGDRRGINERVLELDAMAVALGLDRDILRERLLDVDHRLAAEFSFYLLDRGWRRTALALNPRPPEGLNRSARKGKHPDEQNVDTEVCLSIDLIDILDHPHVEPPRSALVPQIDTESQRWLALLSALHSSGTGAHVALRRLRSSTRDKADLAALIHNIDATLFAVDGSKDHLLADVIRAELHAGPEAPIVLLDVDLQTKTTPKSADHWDAPTEDQEAHEDAAFSQPLWLAKVRGLYLWSTKAEGTLPVAKLPLIGVCLGPIRHDPSWARSIIADHLGEKITDPIASAAVRALAGRLADPRDAGAMVDVARVIASSGLARLDEACAQIAYSFSDKPPAVASPNSFDSRLLVCGVEAHTLLGRARMAAENGVRVLAHGPPGGGKSAYLRELATRMAGGRSIRIVTPASFLARAWGATERLTRELWRRAADEGEILLADEFEVICGRRMHGDMSNNQMLIRNLTDEWLRAMDDFPGVPLLASTNDVAVVDLAAVRRCAFVVEFGDSLSPDQERLAWRILLGREPPPGWSPCSAAVADIVLARQRCRMLGHDDAASFQTSIAAAKAARAGEVVKQNKTAAPPTRH